MDLPEDHGDGGENGCFMNDPCVIPGFVPFLLLIAFIFRPFLIALSFCMKRKTAALRDKEMQKPSEPATIWINVIIFARGTFF